MIILQYAILNFFRYVVVTFFHFSCFVRSFNTDKPWSLYNCKFKIIYLSFLFYHVKNNKRQTKNTSLHSLFQLSWKLLKILKKSWVMLHSTSKMKCRRQNLLPPTIWHMNFRMVRNWWLGMKGFAVQRLYLIIPC